MASRNSETLPTPGPVLPWLGAVRFAVQDIARAATTIGSKTDNISFLTIGNFIRKCCESDVEGNAYGMVGGEEEMEGGDAGVDLLEASEEPYCRILYRFYWTDTPFSRYLSTYLSRYLSTPSALYSCGFREIVDRMDR